ncbi:MAG: glycosyltransferase family 4 protein [Anaerolineae bacterium]
MKIAFVSPSYPPHARGGIGFYVQTVAHALAALGHEIHVIARCDLDQDHESMDGAVAVHWVGPAALRLLWRRPLRWLRTYERHPALLDALGWSWAAASRVRVLARTGHVDIVEACDHSAAGFFCTFLHIPVVVRIHSPLAVNLPAKGQMVTPDLRRVFRLERAAVRRAYSRTAPSRAYAQFIREYWSLPGLSIEIVPNPVDTTRFAPGAGPSAESVRISCIGRLNRQKGVRVYLDAAGLVAQRDMRAMFYVAGPDEGDAPSGDGSYSAYWEEQFPDLRDRMHFLGWVGSNELPQVYRSASIVVVPSSGPENFPIGVVEAMSSGCCVVASRVGGIPEIIDDGVTGCLVEPGDATALAVCLEGLLHDPGRIGAMGQAARRAALDNFSLDCVVPTMTRYYVQTIAAWRSQHAKD